MTRLQPASSARPAEWVVAGLRGFGQSVLSLVPVGLSAYVRIFHPAHRQGPEIGEIVSVRWHEIAAANGRQVHAGMQLSGLTGTLASAELGQPGVFDHPPEIGSLPREQMVALAPILARHTTTPDRCWFAIWDGFGDLPHDVRQGALFAAPHRQYHLLSGPVDALAEVTTIGLRNQSPNLFWPADRAWCVATEIDLDTTYVGCDDGCSDEILTSPELEALAIDPATGIDFASDVLNPLSTPSA